MFNFLVLIIIHALNLKFIYKMFVVVCRRIVNNICKGIVLTIWLVAVWRMDNHYNICEMLSSEILLMRENCFMKENQ